jgi:hypothetical protein
MNVQPLPSHLAQNAQASAPLIAQGAQCAAWTTKILRSGRTPIPVVQARPYRADSTVDVESLSRSSRVRTVTLSASAPSIGRPTSGRRKFESFTTWLWFAGILVLLVFIFAT